MTLDELDKIFVGQPNDQHTLEIALTDIRAWKAERDKLRELIREIVDEGRCDPTIGWFRRAREALAEKE
jgi:hypothetical protein